MSGADDDLLVTPSEAARILQVNVKTIRRYGITGQLVTACRTPGGGRNLGHRRYFRAQCQAYRDGRPLTAEQVEQLRARLGQVRQT